MKTGFKFLLTTMCALGLISMTSSTLKSVAPDAFLWLEEIRSEESLNWVRAKNEISERQLLNDPRYARVEADTRRILLSPDRIAVPREIDGMLYNFWQDANHVRGILRRTTIESYRMAQPTWETVLDVDALAANENENWVYGGLSCLDSRHCLVTLSVGGGDASVTREYNLETKSFPSNGFTIPLSKSDATWIDENTLLVGVGLRPEQLTDSGYSKEIRLWKRGETLDTAKIVFQGNQADVGVWPSSYSQADGSRAIYLIQALTFYSDRTYAVAADGSTSLLAKPDDAYLLTVFQNQPIVALRSAWQTPAGTMKGGSIITNIGTADVKAIYVPTDRSAFTEVAVTKDRLFIATLDNVKGKLLSYLPSEGRWIPTDHPLPGQGMISIVSSSSKSERLLFNYQDFLTPTSLLLADVNASRVSISTLKSLPSVFDATRFEVNQYESTSRDGEKIPYFVISKRGMTLDGSNPTLLYGYGGFEVSMTPSYLSTTGKNWLEQGGVYVLANIRGGGEFGPRWHEAALLKNRQKAYDDFISVAENLISRGITSPRRLGIQGGSNGGLLVGAVMVQRPELFNAVVCQVPLLDMMRYHLLLAGASWMAEYGNPDDAEMREVILRYSPYQNVRAGVQYPKAFFMTSTADDRVHPGHARKMAALMESQGHDLLYFENIEGGHGGAANLEQKIKQLSLTTTYLYQQLVD